MTKSELVKKLRELTNAGMSDCIKALNESNDSIDKAVEWLRKNGTIKAAKKADAVAAEGLVKSVLIDDMVAIVEVNCQTDFVAKNDKFISYTNDVLNEVIKTRNTNINELKINNRPINEIATDLTAVIGEKIVTRRIETLIASNNQSLGTYTHMNNRVSTALLVDGKCDPVILKNVCMHIAAMNPKYLSSNDVSSDWLAKEKELLIEQAKTNTQGKDPKFMDKIIEGRINKLLDEVCLLKQKFVMDNSVTVEQYLKNNGVVANKMLNVILGDGIEKKESNFADEVAEQMKK